MNKFDLQKRTKIFAINCINFCSLLPNKQPGWTISGQLTRCSSSVAANYRAVCRAKSDKDFISKLETVIEEADESAFWLELIQEIKIVNKEFKTVQILIKEANELTAILVSSVNTVKKRIY